MAEAAKAATPIPNATILEEDDPTASAHLYWMMLMICKGAALNIVFLAGDSQVRAEDEDKIRRTADVHLVVLTSRRHS